MQGCWQGDSMGTGARGPHQHLGMLALHDAPDARQALQEVQQALHQTCWEYDGTDAVNKYA